MRILVISSLFPPHTFGGAEIAAYNMVKLLVARGHDVSVATLYEDNEIFSWGDTTPDGYKIFHLRTSRSHTLYGRLQSAGRLRKILWHLQDYFDPRNRREIRRLLEATNPEHIDIHNIIGIGFNCLKDIKNHSATVGWVLHDLALACFNTAMYKNSKSCQSQCIGCKCVSHMRTANLKNFEHLGYLSPSLQNLEKIQNNIPFIKDCTSAVLRNAANDLPALPASQSSDLLRLVYVGRLDSIKGIDFLLDVLQSLPNRQKLHLQVLGTGPLAAELSKKYANEPWVTFRGFVSKDEVAITLKLSDLYCMPSLWAEAYGMTTAQSLQLETPVIGSAIGGTLDLVRHEETGLLLEPGNKAAWVSAFTKIIEDPILVKNWKENTKKYLSEFDRNNLGNNYEAFVSQLKDKNTAKIK